MKCPHCGKSIPSSAQTCPYCGKSTKKLLSLPSSRATILRLLATFSGILLIIAAFFGRQTIDSLFISYSYTWSGIDFWTLLIVGFVSIVAAWIEPLEFLYIVGAGALVARFAPTFKYLGVLSSLKHNLGPAFFRELRTLWGVNSFGTNALVAGTIMTFILAIVYFFRVLSKMVTAGSSSK